jgi:cation transport regulator ChaB
MPLDNYGAIANSMAQLPNPVNAFIDSYQGARQQQRRDSLTDATVARQNALAAQEQQGAQQGQHNQELTQALAKIRWMKSQGNLSGQLKADPQKAAQLSQQLGEDLLALPEDQVVERFNRLEGHLASMLGEMPPQPKEASKPPPLPASVQEFEYAQNNPAFQQYQDRNRVRAESSGGVAAPKPPKAPEGYRWAADGQSLEVIPGGPKDATAPAPMSAKDRNTARVKLTQVSVARRQLQDAKQKYAALKGSLAAGPGGGLLPTPGGKAYDAAIDTMRSSISALTRVPGVGAMSDYETRLDQAKFPTRNNYEEVGAQQLQALEDQLNTIEQNYREMLGGGAPAAPVEPQAEDFPSASANKGRRIKDKSTGKTFKSDGNSWIPE